MNHFSELSLVHDVLGRMYLLAFNFENEEEFDNEEVLGELKKMIRNQEELLQCIENQSKQ